MFINQVLNAVIQIVLFAVIPFLWWLVSARKKESFWSWIGLKKVKAESDSKFLLLLAGSCLACFVLGQAAIWMRGDLEAADSAYKGMGVSAIPSILVYAFGQTAFSEELLFRGFLMKRLQAKWGFHIAVMIQAVIFGVLHLLMVWGQADFMAGMIIVVYPMVVAVLLSWINEKKADGSIYPSWIIHGVLNSVEGILQALL